MISDQLFLSKGTGVVSRTQGSILLLYQLFRVLDVNCNFSISYKNNKIDQHNPLLNEIQYIASDIFK